LLEKVKVKVKICKGMYECKHRGKGKPTLGPYGIGVCYEKLNIMVKVEVEVEVVVEVQG
jgi:hypothetical protein